MKKILLGLIVIAMVLALTACSQDQYEQLGKMMGDMKGNVYGIEANLKDVENATNKVDGAVVQNGDEVTVKLEADTAKSIVNSVVAVKNSDTKKEALKASLSEPLLGKGTSDATWASLKIEIAAQATSNKISDEEKASYSAERAEIATAVNDALSAVGASLSAKPTKAELATVAVLTTLAEAVKSGDEEAYKAAGKAAVDALKITSEIGQVDVFANIDLSKLSEIFAKGVSRDGDADEKDTLEKFLPVIGDSIPQVLECITEKKNFKDQRYLKFLMECKAIRASYEMIAKAYDIKTDELLKGQATVDSGLTIEDLGHYIISVIFSAMDYYDGETNVAIPFLRALVTEENYDYIANVNREKLEELVDTIPAYEVATDTMVSIMDEDFVPDEDFDFAEFVKTSIRDTDTEIGERTDAVLRTIGVILLNSEYEALLDQIPVEVGEGETKPADGSLRCFLYVF